MRRLDKLGLLSAILDLITPSDDDCSTCAVCHLCPRASEDFDAPGPGTDDVRTVDCGLSGLWVGPETPGAVRLVLEDLEAAREQHGDWHRLVFPDIEAQGEAMNHMRRAAMMADLAAAADGMGTCATCANADVCPDSTTKTGPGAGVFAHPVTPEA